ncbi:MAG TPA: hypothetical protein VH138_05880, partial [Vicinamibacterales bacterium]|nr:hypothetical protein [Vicinamibacterales bacterium]
MTDRVGKPQLTEIVAVLDMGASAIRLVVSEILSDGTTRTIDEGSRGMLLGKDTFSAGVIRARTIETALSALEGFRRIIDGYKVARIRAVAKSAVREARNVDLFLDRIQRRTGITVDIIDEAEESRLVFLAVRQALKKTPALRAAWTLLTEVGGGSTSVTLLHQGQPNRSAVYALGAVRLRQQLDLQRLSHDIQLSLLRRSIANMIDEITPDTPLRRVTQMIALGGDVRFAAAQIVPDCGDHDLRVVPRDSFLAFCDQIEQYDEEQLAERFGLPPVEAETLVPSLLVYRNLLSQTASHALTVPDASLRSGVLLDLVEPGGPSAVADFSQQVLASAEAL